MSKPHSPRRATLTLAAIATLGAVALPAQAQLSVGGAGTKATLGGYIKADALFNTRSVGGSADIDGIFGASQIPVGTSSPGERKQITLHARESRFNLRTSTPTAMGEMVTFMEMDFFSPSANLAGNEVVSNSHGMRLRHAYGALGAILAGQTWTNFMEVASLPETLDFGGPVGHTFVRQTQLRYTTKFDGGQLAVALENPETVAVPGGPAGDDRVPDVTANLGMNTGFGKFNLTGLVRRLRVDTATVVNETDTGWGVSLYGVVPTIGKDTIYLLATAGEGIGRYFAGTMPDAFVTAGGNIQAQNHYAGRIAYRHFWTNELRSTVAAAVQIADNSNAIAAANPTANKRFSSIHANLLYSPVPNVTAGIEYRFGKRVTEGIGSGISQAIQLSAKFGF